MKKHPSGVVDRAILFPLGVYGKNYFYFGTKLSVRERNSPVVARFKLPKKGDNYSIGSDHFMPLSDRK